MSTVANLLAQKQRLLERLENDPGPNERDEIERLLAKIETALTWLESNDGVEEGGRL
ncbi:hypothetical protein [Bradyrhizobium sp. CB1015]|uniref:hypothetical protein n=1 Tax=Bradyrhizobium sp. CB1015 TaxID=2976822 RepID=UPI0021A9D3A0|nr:hypothetical protein [Bradyrhizobium sp. CB1015]UWU94160.1 hypothetical protein N2604_10000 [Bradyrhizobium sp. CB1015]